MMKFTILFIFAASAAAAEDFRYKETIFAWHYMIVLDIQQEAISKCFELTASFRRRGKSFAGIGASCSDNLNERWSVSACGTRSNVDGDLEDVLQKIAESCD